MSVICNPFRRTQRLFCVIRLTFLPPVSITDRRFNRRSSSTPDRDCSCAQMSRVRHGPAKPPVRWSHVRFLAKGVSVTSRATSEPSASERVLPGARKSGRGGLVTTPVSNRALTLCWCRARRHVSYCRTLAGCTQPTAWLVLEVHRGPRWMQHACSARVVGELRTPRIALE